MTQHAAHDWHSVEYVDEWLRRDLAEHPERPAARAEMLALAAFPKDAPIRVIDVAAGSGQVAADVLNVFPNARVTVQDYSTIMLDRARARLATYGEQVTYVLSDLFDPAWPQSVGGPFDLAVSGISIHCLRDPAAIAATYAAIRGLLAPGGIFLNCDHFFAMGGIELHAEQHKRGGFTRVEAVRDGRPGIIAAYA